MTAQLIWLVVRRLYPPGPEVLNFFGTPSRLPANSPGPVCFPSGRFDQRVILTPAITVALNHCRGAGRDVRADCHPKALPPFGALA